MKRLFLLLLPCLCAVAQSPLERAAALARQRQYAEAKRAIEGAPEPPDPGQRIAFHRLRAAIASGTGDAAEAAREMELVLRLAPDNKDLFLPTAVAELQAGLLDEALEHARAAGPTATAEAITGDILEKKGEFHGAAQAYREAVHLDPSREDLRVALAYQLITHQDFSSAIPFLDESVARFPNSARLFTLLGIAHYGNGDIDDGVKALTQAIAADARFEPAYRSLARMVLETSAPPPSTVVGQLCGWDEVVCNALKLRAAREQDDTKALAAALAALRGAAPNNAVAQCELGRAYEWSGRLPEARAALEACVTADPSPANHYRLGLVYQRLGMRDLAAKEMAMRGEILRKMSEQTAAGLRALQSFR